jgi:glycosyltransferase involved in cell wall biosynthesis
MKNLRNSLQGPSKNTRNSSIKKISVSVIIPAFNEEKTVAHAVHSVIKICSLAKTNYEILIYDDGSTDSTGKIADRVAAANKNVRVVHNGTNRGLGYIFRDSIQKITKTFFMFYPGDADMASWFLLDLLEETGSADLIIAYPRDVEARPFGRRILSAGFVYCMNKLLNLHFRYYTGPFICKVAPVKKLPSVSNGYTAFFEFKVRLVKSGYSYKEIPFDHVGRSHGSTKMFTLHTMLDVLQMMIILRLTT